MLVSTQDRASDPVLETTRYNRLAKTSSFICTIFKSITSGNFRGIKEQSTKS